MPRLQTTVTATTVWGGTATIWNPSPDSPVPGAVGLTGIILGTATAFSVSISQTASLRSFRQAIMEATGVPPMLLFRVNDHSMLATDPRILRVARERECSKMTGLPNCAVVLLAASTLVKGEEASVGDWFPDAFKGGEKAAGGTVHFLVVVNESTTTDFRLEGPTKDDNSGVSKAAENPRNPITSDPMHLNGSIAATHSTADPSRRTCEHVLPQRESPSIHTATSPTPTPSPPPVSMPVPPIRSESKNNAILLNGSFGSSTFSSAPSQAATTRSSSPGVPQPPLRTPPIPTQMITAASFPFPPPPDPEPSPRTLPPPRGRSSSQPPDARQIAEQSYPSPATTPRGGLEGVASRPPHLNVMITSPKTPRYSFLFSDDTALPSPQAIQTSHHQRTTRGDVPIRIPVRTELSLNGSDEFRLGGGYAAAVAAVAAASTSQLYPSQQNSDQSSRPPLRNAFSNQNLYQVPPRTVAASLPRMMDASMRPSNSSSEIERGRSRNPTAMNGETLIPSTPFSFPRNIRDAPPRSFYPPSEFERGRSPPPPLVKSKQARGDGLTSSPTLRRILSGEEGANESGGGRWKGNPKKMKQFFPELNTAGLMEPPPYIPR
ncbi:hypothetical protein HDU67_002512 [Dinochytrium kinnereticum]|nr:hypothetical protein HDU67_002512 [Dinochytrium kinnereticum]